MKVYIPVHRCNDNDYEDYIIGVFRTLEEAQKASEVEVKEMQHEGLKEPYWSLSPYFWIYNEDYPFGCIDIDEHEIVDN